MKYRDLVAVEDIDRDEMVAIAGGEVDPTPTFGTATHNIVEIGRETFGVYGKPAALGEDGFGVWGPGTQYETWPEADQDLGRTARRNLNPGVDLGGVGPFAP